MMDSTVYAYFSALWEYPSPELRGRLPAYVAAVSAMLPEVATHLQRFRSTVDGLADADWEEMFVRTFDFNPDCALEVGWHLFGEDYKRGEMLAFLRGEMNRCGVPENGELPDHLGNLLRLLASGWDSDGRFTRRFLIPALTRLHKALTASNPAYAELTQALEGVIRVRSGSVSRPEWTGATREEIP